MEHFDVRAYGFQELAVLYFPHSTPDAASVQLRKWVRHPRLLVKLEATGYHAGQKILTPLQVGIIVEHVGEP